jgi:hypothetical protein
MWRLRFALSVLLALLPSWLKFPLVTRGNEAVETQFGLNHGPH